MAGALAAPAEGKRICRRNHCSCHRLDLDTEGFVLVLEEGGGAARLLVGHDLGEGDAWVVIDSNMDELPARPLTRTASVLCSRQSSAT
jgi:hypothetical protein